MRRAVTLGIVLLLLLCMNLSMRGSADLRNQCQSVSLRYRQPFAVQQPASEHSYTFWTEQAALLSTDYRAQQSRVLLYSGDAALIYGKRCIAGGMPGPLDETGCALSSALAHQLFGSEDVVGLELRANDKRYTIRGVFEDELPLALLAEPSAPFTAVECALTDDAIQDPEGWLPELLRSEELPQPDWVLYPHELSAFVELLTWLPVLFGSFLLAAWIFKSAQSWPIYARDTTLFLLALTLAVALPAFFSVWPQWLTPSRWSDFSWWSTVFDQLAQHGRDWLSVIPAGRDLLIKTIFIKQLVLAAAECVLCEMLRCRFWHSLRQNAD